MSAVGNVYIRGPNTVGTPAVAIEVTSAVPSNSQLYINDNLLVEPAVTLYQNNASFDPLVSSPPIWLDDGYNPMPSSAMTSSA